MPSRARTPATKTWALLASRVADVAQNRTRVAPWSRISTAYSSSAANARSSAAWRELARTVDTLTEADPSASLGTATSGRRADQQLDRVGAAVDRSDYLASRRSLRGPAHPSVGRPSTHGPSAHHSPSSVEHLVAERVHTRALRQRLPGQDVQALDPVGHPAGGDALDLGYVEPGLPAELGASLEVALVRDAVRRRAAPRSTGQPGLHLLHQAGSLERPHVRSHPWAGQVERRREGRAVGQPGLGRHDIGQPAPAAVTDPWWMAPRLPPQLLLDRGRPVDPSSITPAFRRSRWPAACRHRPSPPAAYRRAPRTPRRWSTTRSARP